MENSTLIYLTSPFLILGLADISFHSYFTFYRFFMSNSGNPDQMHYAPFGDILQKGHQAYMC